MTLLLTTLASAAFAQDAPAPHMEPEPVVERVEVQATPPAAPRIVREAYAEVHAANPLSRAESFLKTVESAGGHLVASSKSLNPQWEDSASLDVLIPVDQWARVESALNLGTSGSLHTDSIQRADQEGTGLPHVSLSVEFNEPMGNEPNFLIGPVGGLSIPADNTGLGVAQVVGVRAMDADRASDFRVLYAPTNARYADKAEPWMIQLTGGATMYSDYMGGGERTFLNPYIGGHLGYAYRGESWFLLQAEAGIELVHARNVIWDVYVRPTGAFRKGEVGLSVEVGTGLVVPF